MRSREGESLLRRHVAPALALHGFSEGQPLVFVRQEDGGRQLTTFGTRLDSEARFCFSVGFGIEFDAIQRLLGVAEPLTPTIGLTLDSLRPAPGFTEWRFSDEGGVRGVAESALEAVEKHGLPFLRKYSDLREVRTCLESEDPRNWFCLSPTERIEVLAAAVAVQGDTSGAQELILRALRERVDALPKERRPLERLLSRLA